MCRFRLRTLLIVIAIIAAVCGAAPWIAFNMSWHPDIPIAEAHMRVMYEKKISPGLSSCHEWHVFCFRWNGSADAEMQRLFGSSITILNWRIAGASADMTPPSPP